VAVDKLYLFYACIFYKFMAIVRPSWEPTLRYPRKWKKGVKPPKVCVQLPMFNETFVARRIIDYTCRMEYPRESFYVQCLDDSTDPVTRNVVDEGVRYWRAQGVNIEAIRRTNRQGYKAGAMHEVHDAVPAEFIVRPRHAPLHTHTRTRTPAHAHTHPHTRTRTPAHAAPTCRPPPPQPRHPHLSRLVSSLASPSRLPLSYPHRPFSMRTSSQSGTSSSAPYRHSRTRM
jgi:hypothetical protein